MNCFWKVTILINPFQGFEKFRNNVIVGKKKKDSGINKLFPGKNARGTFLLKISLPDSFQKISLEIINDWLEIVFSYVSLKLSKIVN